MLSLLTKIQLTAFFIISILGVTYTAVRYAGLEAVITGSSGCTVHADFPDSGGIFPSAEVTYRGVGAGRVSAMHVLPNGVRVDLQLTTCKNIPLDSSATVTDLSAVGQQYVNLVPITTGGRSLSAGDVLPMSGNKLPLPTEVLLANLDQLANSVDPTDLQTVVDELGKAFTGRTAAMSQLLSSGSALIAKAIQSLPDTIALINQLDPVLQTQIDTSQDFQSWASSLNSLSAQLKQSDPDIRSLLQTAPSALATINSFVSSTQSQLGVLLANLVNPSKSGLADVVYRNQGGIPELLELYPTLVSDGSAAYAGGTLNLGLVIDSGNTLTKCPGYGIPSPRLPSATTPAPVDTSVHCTSGGPIRGAAQVPGGDPVSTAGGGAAYQGTGTPIPAAYIDGSSSTSAAVLGDASWVPLITKGMS